MFASLIRPASAITVIQATRRGHEPLQQRDERLVSTGCLQTLDHQRYPGGVGEQPDGDLRVEAAYLGEPRLAETVRESVWNHSVVTSYSTNADGPSSSGGRAHPDTDPPFRLANEQRRSLCDTTRTTPARPTPSGA